MSQSGIFMSKTFVGSEMENRLIASAEIGDLSGVKKLLKYRVNPNSKDEDGMCALTKACAGGHTPVVKLLIENNVDVNLKGRLNITPLHAAVSGNHSEIVKHLLIAGAKLEAMTVTGIKPIDLTKHESEIWNIINDAKQGDLPEIEEVSEVFEVPDFSIPGGEGKKKKKSAKGKKGKKGKGKKKGGKKGGKKKKKK